MRTASTILIQMAWLMAAAPVAAQSFVTFETGQVRPLALSPDGTRLFAINTPDNRLEIFNVSGGSLVPAGGVPVGMEPIAVAARTNTEVWVVNHLSDSISIVDVGATPPRVVRTLHTCDEPRDIVFAGPGGGRAFVTTARRGQNCPVAANLTTEGIGRAVVQVFDGATLGGAGMGGTPLQNIVLFGDTPRALAVAPGGNTVYAAVFHSGNQTTAVTEGAVCNGGGAAAACNLDGTVMPGGLPGGQVPGGLPAPSPRNCAMQTQPETGLIVKFDPDDSIWKDELGRNWNNAVRFSLPDEDVFPIDANAMTAGSPWTSVGTVLFNMAVNPVSGRVYVSNTEAVNEVRFEGPGMCSTTVRGHLHEARISVLDGPNVNARHLNKHIDYDVVPSPLSVKEDSLAIPVGMAVNAAGTTLYLAAFGSGKIGRFTTAQLEGNTFVPDSSTHIGVSGGGPSGLVLNEAVSRLYVLTRFDNSISVINTVTNAEIDTLPLFNPEPAVVVDGRPFLYDAEFTSSNGEASCASCHIFGDFDSLGWDLGNPDDGPLNNPNPFEFGGSANFAPMKGPMTTQTLRGMANNGPMHWRGDRTGGNDIGGNALAEDQAFRKFNVAFDGLLGRGGPIPTTDMDKFTAFILEVVLPPNPIRPLTNMLDPAVAGARAEYMDDSNLSDLIRSCNGCHTLNPALGAFGTDGEMSFENETQDFKIPHLRNMYQKVGMFGFPDSPFIKPGNNGDQGPQVRGFGFLHDGSIDTLFRFHRANVFNLSVAQAVNMEAFMMQFDTDLAPIVGQQVTLTSGNAAAVNPRIDLMILRDNANECEMVVKGSKSGAQRGWVRIAAGTFRSDRASEPLLTDAQLRTEAASAGQERTYTCVPPGSGTRIGIDRDSDGCFDRDELDLGSDPADAGSNSCLGSSTTTTTNTTSPGSTTTSTTLVPLCGAQPATGCRPAAFAKSTLFLRDSSNNLNDRFRWHWKGGGTALGHFFDPINGTAEYAFCVYDSDTLRPQPLLESRVLPGGTCDGRPCWKTIGSIGFRQKNKAATPEGINRVTLRAGFISPQAAVNAAGRGANLQMPNLGLDLPVTVQLVISDAGSTECWQAQFFAPTKNDFGQFRSKNP
jgi:YVTN family beta-propeller protein